MKSKIVLVGALLLFSIGLQAQNSKNKNKVHKVWVSKVDNSKTIKGVLYKVNDESIILVDGHTKETIIEVSTIKIIKVRRKGSVGKGFLFGALTGFTVGGLLGLMSGDDPDKTVPFPPFGQITVEGTKKEEKAIMLAVPLAIVAGGTGAIIASTRNKILIDGNIENYKSQLEVLRNYSTAID